MSDEDVVKAALEPTFSKTVRQFGDYFDFRSRTGSPDAFKELTTLVKSWEEVPAPEPRPPANAP